MRRRAVIAAVLALAATGCASDDRELRRDLLAERLETQTIITREEIAAQKPGSPGRAVLVLWRAVQYRNPQAALARVSPPPNREQLKGFEDFIVGTGAQAAATTKPTIVEVEESGTSARVFVEFIRHRKVGDQVRARVTGRLGVELVRTGEGWLVLWRKAADALPGAIS